MTLDLERIGSVAREATGQRDELVYLADRFAELATPSSTSRLVFDHDELQIRISSRANDPIVNQLRQIEPLEISAAPVVAATFSATNAHVVVLRYWACPGEQRVEPKNPAVVAEPVRRRFRDDIARLASAGFMHEYAIRGASYWRQAARTDTYVLEDWTNLVPIEDAEKVVQRLSAMLALP